MTIARILSRATRTLSFVSLLSSLVFADASAQSGRSPDCSSAQSAVPVTLPVVVRGNHFFVTVCRGERRLSFILDTGAPASLLDLAVAESMGIPTRGTTHSGGAGPGQAAGAQLQTDSVRLAGTKVFAPIASALDMRGVSERAGIRVDGILGADFIARFVLTLAYHDSTLALLDPAAFRYAGQGTTVPFIFRGRFIFVKGALGLADGSQIPGEFVVDVGSGASLSLAKPFVEANHLRDRVGATVHRPAGFGVGGATWADMGRATSFSIGGVVLTHPTVFLYGDSAGVFSTNNLRDGNIGGDILRRFTVSLDYRRREMIFEPNADVSEPFELDMTGLALVPIPGESMAQVIHVVPSSTAANAGLLVGDTVVAVNGHPASADELDATAVLRRRENERLTYTVRRGGADVVIVVVTKRII